MVLTAGDSVVFVDRCELSVIDEAWGYALEHTAAIDLHWDHRRAVNPSFFNGVIFVLRRGAIQNGVFSGSFLRTDFKSFLFWREQGYPEAGVRDSFGSAVLRSQEGHILLGRQSAGNINAGLAYLPGGFIDVRDVDDTGRIDIAGSIAREIAEETGLATDEMAAASRYIITRCGPHLSIGREFTIPAPAEDIRARILARLSAEADPELDDIVTIASVSDLNGAQVPPYTALVVRALLDRGSA